MDALAPAQPRHLRGSAPPRYRLRDRLRARWLTRTLDQALAEGAPRDRSPALELRAKALGRPSVAHELGSQFRVIVHNAEAPPRPSSRVRACRESVLAAEHELRLLASRLQAANPVPARAVAKAYLLLTDGTGPLYYPDNSGSLLAAIRDTAAAL